MQRMRGNGPRSLKCAWRVDPQELEMVADVSVPGLTRRAGSTGIEWTDDNPIADLPTSDVLADLGDFARHLVSDNLWNRHALVHVALKDVQVCAAHAAVGDVDAHLLWAWRLRDGLSELKEEGIVRSVGCSCHSHAALKTAAEHPWVDVVLARINPEGAVMDPKAEVGEVAETLKRARANGKGVIGMKVFGCGRLVDPKQRSESLRYVFENGLVDAVTLGFTAPRQIDDAVERIDGILKGSV